MKCIASTTINEPSGWSNRKRSLSVRLKTAIQIFREHVKSSDG